LKNFLGATAPEYNEWITEATCPETRGKRLATTLAWLAAGKTRNGKHADCRLPRRSPSGRKKARSKPGSLVRTRRGECSLRSVYFFSV